MDQIFKITDWVTKITPPKKINAVDLTGQVNQITLSRHGGFITPVAGFSGALAMILGAYGAHSLKQKDVSDERKLAFETGNKHHLIHSVALLSISVTRRPKLTAFLLAGGILLFSGSCYWYALTDNKTIKKLTPAGGMMLILAYVSMMF